MDTVYTGNADWYDWLRNCLPFQNPTVRKYVENINFLPNKQQDPWIGDFKYAHWLGRAENCENRKRGKKPAENLGFIMEFIMEVKETSR